MNTTAARIIPPVQMDRADALARAFGHEWATSTMLAPHTYGGHGLPGGRSDEELPSELVGLEAFACCPGCRGDYEPLHFPTSYTVEGIAATVQGNPNRSEMGGISAPSWGVPGAPGVFGRSDYLTHSTGTGRVSWAVAPDGTVHVIVSRPGGNVLRFLVTPRQTRVTPEDSGAARLRHWEAAREVCTALGCTLVPPLSVAAIWARPSWSTVSGCASAEGPAYEAWTTATSAAERECDAELGEFGARRAAYL